MIQKFSQTKKQKPQTWISDPHPGHLVHFYESESELLAPLGEYLRGGLEAGETCIVIATQNHILALSDMLSHDDSISGNTTLPANILAYDAEEMLSKFMVGNRPDRTKFMDTVGLLVHNAVQLQKPIRAYGEMVALLWKAGRKEAVIKLEQYWNLLADENDFSLYCAYPKLQFIYDPDQIKVIDRQHGLHLSAGAYA